MITDEARRTVFRLILAYCSGIIFFIIEWIFILNWFNLFYVFTFLIEGMRKYNNIESMLFQTKQKKIHFEIIDEGC